MISDKLELVPEEEEEIPKKTTDITIDMSSHCHNDDELYSKDKNAQNVLIIVSCLTVVFITLEIIGGYIASSLAIMTDAAHMLSDFGGFMISLFAVWLGRRPANGKMSFGYYRAEVLGAVCSILSIWLLTGVLIYLAIERIIHQDYQIDANVMIATAGAGIIFNIIMGSILHWYGGGHGHSHGHSGHSHHSQESSDIEMKPIENNSKNHNHIENKPNINIRAAFIHVIGDFVQSIGVFLAALIIKIKPEYHLVDPICTFLFSILVLITTITVMRDAIHVLMEGSPRDVDYSQLLEELRSIRGVKATHSFHMWSLTTDKSASSVHLVIDEPVDAIRVVTDANRVMRGKYKITFTTIQVDPYDPLIMTICRQCKEPGLEKKENSENSWDTDNITHESNIYGTFEK